MASFMDTSMMSVGEYIERCRMITVPEFQRSYAWTEDEVSQLWQDVRGSMESGRLEYFIGPIVVKGKDSAMVEVIDGQQRLATILIMLNTLRQEFRRNGDSDRACIITENYFIGKKDIKTLQADQKFAMNSENGDTYRSYIGTEVAVDIVRKAYEKVPKGRSNRLLLEASISSFDELLEYQGTTFDKDRLIKLLGYITENVKVLVLSVEDEADAYTIFETLNDRGRSLDTLDLLKNHLFAKAKNALPEIQSKWTSIRDDLNEVDPKNRFLHHYWTSIHGQTPTNSLFRNIRSEITTPVGAVNFAGRMAEAAKIYEALQNHGSAFWDDYAQEVRAHIASLRLLDSQQALPMLLAAQPNFDKAEFVKLCRLLVVMAVRYNFIGEGRTGVLSNSYSDAAKKIASKDYKKASQVAAALKPIYPTDSDFKQAFERKDSKDAKRVRYILAGIEATMQNSAMKVESDPAKINLEHIMPKKQNQHWSAQITSIAAEDYETYANRLGNQALVPKTKNKAAGSKSFDEKKTALLSSSPFLSTREAAKAAIWDASAIEKRQSFLATHALKAWHYPML